LYVRLSSATVTPSPGKMLRARSCARLVLVTGVCISVWRSSVPDMALCGVHKVVVNPCGSVCRKQCRSRPPLDALPDGADLLQYLIVMPEDAASQLQHVADTAIATGSWFETHATVPDLRLMPPAFADVGAAKLPAMVPDVKYLYGADGEVLREPSTLRPLQDDCGTRRLGHRPTS